MLYKVYSFFIVYSIQFSEVGVGRKKITVVGSGHVGTHAALWASTKELGDVVLIDIIEGVPQGMGLDLFEASPVESFDSRIIGTNDYKDTEGSDIIIVTAGLPRKPGMTREDLLAKNASIVKSVVEESVKYSPDAFLIIVTNPLDTMAYVAKEASGFAKNRVMGMAGILDSARLRAFIAMELNVSVEDITAFVMGGHGDEMVPLPRYSTVAGIPITELMSKDRIDALVDRTRKGGGEIVAFLKTGSAYFAPSASAVEMAEAILKDKKRILPCSAFLEGEYGMNGFYLGVPVKLGSNGVEEIIEIDLTDEERDALNRSAEVVQESIKSII
jgi:malate dehydrogenase